MTGDPLSRNSRPLTADEAYRLNALEEAAEDVLASLDRIYPKDGKIFPDGTLFSAMERLRKALP